MPEMRQVYSSHIVEIGYDPITQSLHVSYANGTIGYYADVPSDIAMNVVSNNVPSFGEALHTHIRGRFPFTYLGRANDDR